MPKFKTARFKELIKDLSQDPKFKAALEKVAEKSKAGLHVKSLKEFLPLIGKLSTKFGGKKTMAVTETITLFIVLFEVSVLIKQNVFDKPEVKQFFSENWGALQKRVAAMYLFVSNYVRAKISERRAGRSGPAAPSGE
jgi:hypothetical protein